MAKLIAVILIFAVAIAQAKSLKLELYADTVLPQKGSLKGEAVGGISGFSWDGQKLWAVSDDRGKFGSPRFYEMDLKISSGKVEIKPTKVHKLQVPDKKWILDLEALVLLPSNEIILSTEGDNNTKPRSMPHIFVTDRDGEYKSDLPIPDIFLPEAIGLQTKGIENNRGFEGVTATADGKNIYALNEYPVIADQPKKDDTNLWLRLVHFTKDGETYKVTEEFPYLLEHYSNSDKGPEVFRGVSEILYVSDNKFLVLERGARLSAKGLLYTGAIYLVDFQGTKDISKIASLSTAEVSSPRKEKLVDFEELSPKDKVQNFECLSWGPALPDGRKTLLVMSDNNFSSREKTQLLVFAVKEVE
jgi:3-phytase